jgi:O-antigen ligase
MYVLSITEGRSGFIAGTLLMLSFVFLELFNRWKIMGVISVLLLPLIFVGIVSTQRRMNEEMVKREPRLFLWESAWNVIKEKPVLGYGISGAQAAFKVERTKNQDKDYENYAAGHPLIDSHNQYLQTCMEFGLSGLMLLLFIYISPVFISDKRRKFFSIYIIFLCLFQSVFDMFITGTFSLLFGILMLMVLRAQTEPGFSMVESDENKPVE